MFSKSTGRNAIEYFSPDTEIAISDISITTPTITEWLPKKKDKKETTQGIYVAPYAKGNPYMGHHYIGLSRGNGRKSVPEQLKLWQQSLHEDLWMFDREHNKLVLKYATKMGELATSSQTDPEYQRIFGEQTRAHEETHRMQEIRFEENYLWLEGYNTLNALVSAPPPYDLERIINLQKALFTLETLSETQSLANEINNVARCSEAADTINRIATLSTVYLGSMSIYMLTDEVRFASQGILNQLHYDPEIKGRDMQGEVEACSASILVLQDPGFLDCLQSDFHHPSIECDLSRSLQANLFDHQRVLELASSNDFLLALDYTYHQWVYNLRNILSKCRI